ncbi:TIGR03943 family protein [Sphaerisporangium siamense]|uniref:Putative repeat protein (TIGR03943 family) n=2 Tax=Sphaerisporangium siamense TaxID=795645 RepID=A0A7W7D6T9_9ACTN|nr:putative repeat protein (TIGR03943 family) [Sphaerisporangium siamense]GII84656.1 TIGR03943 family protein [Sphaerisporangium siamense]
MNRMAQSLVLTLLGGAVLRVSALSDIYVNYVKPGFRLPLVVAGLVILLLGVLGVAKEWRRPYPGKGPGQDGHGHGPWVAWLLCLPVIAIFLISPPPLGSYAAERDQTPPPRPAPVGAYVAIAPGTATAMPVGEFIGRAWGDPNQSLRGRQVRLVGFVVPSKKKGQWYLTRMQLRCCAADAFPLKVAVLGAAAPRADTWVEVTGTWVPTPYDRLPKGTVAPEMKATRVAKVNQPGEPYE